MRRCHKANFSVARLPHAPVHRESDDAVLDTTDAGWERLVVGIYGKTLLASVKVFLDPFDILVNPLIRLAAANKEVILEVSRASGVTIGGINFFVPRMRDCHELVGKAEVKMALV